MADKFTDKKIEKLRPEASIVDIREGNGFGIRVLPSGVKTWFYIYRYDGKRRFLNLGHYPAVTLADARIKHRAALSLVENGKDPLTLAEEEKEGRRTALTVKELCKEYIEKHAMKFKRSWKQDHALLNREILPAWGKRKAEDIKKRDVTLLLESIVERDAPSMSNQTLKIVRKMFNFAVERDILPHSPCLGVKALAPETPRERTLSEDEIKTLWQTIESSAVSEEIRRSLKLILVTAQRPGEVIGMHTGEIDAHWWTIPVERSKNKQGHRVYLTNTALALIGPLEVFDEETGEMKPKGYIFPCPHQKKVRSIESHAQAVAVRRNLAWPLTDKKGKPLYDADGKSATENKLGIAHFTPHDLRRTAATFMAQMGFMDEVIDAVLNHKKQGVIKVYNQYRYDKEKQQALETWERKLNGIISATESKVISIQSGRKKAA